MNATQDQYKKVIVSDKKLLDVRDIPSGFKLNRDRIIPEGWNKKKLDELLLIIRNGAVYKPALRDGVPITRIETISNGVIDFFRVGYAQPDAILENYLMEEGDILYSHINSIDHIGKVAIFKGGRILYHGMNLVLLRAGEETNPYWLYYQLVSDPARKWARSIAKQAVNQASINTKELKSFWILTPDKTEQNAIAEVLSDVDGLLAALDRLIEKKREIKQAAMQQLLAGKTRLPGFSGVWDIVKVSDFGEVITGGTPSTQIDKYWNGDIPWVTPTDITTIRDIEVTERMITKKGLTSIRELPANSLLITCIASIGKNAILRKIGGCNQQINAIVPNKNHSIEFLYYFFEHNKSFLLANAGITATSIISKKDFCGFEFRIPLIEEQIAIASILSGMDAEIEALERRREKVRQIKQGMMQELLNGRIRLI